MASKGLEAVLELRRKTAELHSQNAMIRTLRDKLERAESTKTSFAIEHENLIHEQKQLQKDLAAVAIARASAQDSLNTIQTQIQTIRAELDSLNDSHELELHVNKLRADLGLCPIESHDHNDDSDNKDNVDTKDHSDHHDNVADYLNNRRLLWFANGLTDADVKHLQLDASDKPPSARSSSSKKHSSSSKRSAGQSSKASKKKG